MENDDHVCYITVSMIERMGHDVQSCETGMEALEHLEEEGVSYDIVISDYMMPVMTGVEMAEKIEKRFPGLPVILLSGYSREKLDEIVKSSPTVIAALSKPVNKKILSGYIDDIIKSKRQAA